MKQRGPKSAQGQTAVLPQRPTAPAYMNAESQAVWKQVVDALPADWFNPTNLPLLEQYCEHIVSHRRMQTLVEGMEAGMAPKTPQGQFKAVLAGIPKAADIKQYKELVKLREAESRTCTALARSMRITQQSMYQKTKSRNITTTRKPWETE